MRVVIHLLLPLQNVQEKFLKLYKNGETLEEKPVKTAVEEIASGKCKIVSTAEVSAE